MSYRCPLSCPRGETARKSNTRLTCVGNISASVEDGTNFLAELYADECGYSSVNTACHFTYTLKQ